MIAKMKELINIPSVRYTVMSIIASGLNFLTLILWGRVFSVEDYGIATTLQALVTNVAISMTPLQIMMCTALAGDSVYKSKSVESITSIFGFINIVELVVMIGAAGKIKQYLYFTGIIEVILFIVLVVLNNTYTVLTGVVQGKQDFSLLGKVGIILYFIKLIVSVLLGIGGIGPLAVIGGFALAEIVCVVLMIKKLVKRIKMPWKRYKFQVDQGIVKQYIGMFVLYGIVSLYMNNGDLLLGNLYCGKEELGLYSATIGLAKISVFLIATPIATVMLPKMVAVKGKKKEQQGMLVMAETITLGVSLLYGICFCAAGGWAIPIVYGESYSGAREYILPCMLFSIVLGVFWVFYQYILATDLTKIFTAVTVVIGIFAVVWIMRMEGDIRSIPIAMAVAMILTMVIVVISRKYIMSKYEKI